MYLFRDQHLGFVMVGMEYCENGSLVKYVKDLNMKAMNEQVYLKFI